MSSQHVTPPQAHPKKGASHTIRHKLSRINRPTWIALSIAFVLLVAIVIALILASTRSQIDSSRYQAVFLSNGQVYFGKLHGYYGSRPYLTDVYYIQGDSQLNSNEQTAPSTNQQLVRLGNEIHKPENTMILNKPSILFVENLQSDGTVMKLIEEDKKSD